jgi:predicted Zn-dependent protease
MYQRVNQASKSASTLLKGNRKYPGNFKLLYALFDLYQNKGDRAEAEKYLAELRTRFPDDANVRRLISAFSAGGAN